MSRSLKVLLVEDNPGDADLVKEYLSQSRQAVFDVECVPRLAQAISILEREPIDAVLLDLGLPDSSGLETLERILEVASRIPTVVLTALDDELTGMEAVRLGAQDYLSKVRLAPDLLIRTCLYSVERMRTHQELHESEERFRRLFEQSPIGVAVLDLDYRFARVNPKLCGLVGYDEDELTKLTSVDITHPDDLRQSRKLLLGEIPGNKIEKRYICKNGQILWIDLTGTLVRDEEGQPLYFLVTIEDIAERKRSEDALRESERQFRSLFENSIDAILLTIPDGRILRANSAACQMFGLTEEEIRRIGREGVVDITDPRLKVALEERKRTGKFQGELNFKRKDGGFFPAELSTVLFQDSEGQWKTTMIIRDVTDRRRSEEAQKRLTTAVEQAAEAIVITDDNGIIQYVNPAFERIAGYSREEAIGQNPRLLKSGEHDTKFYEQMWNTIKGGRVWSGELVNRKKDGQIYHEQATISPVKDASGKIVNFVAVKRDITEHLELSKQLFQAQKMEAIGTLAGGVAHDFNNVLQVALGYSELILGDQELPQRYKADLRQINEASRRGAELVQRLLTFSRKTEVKPLPLNLNLRIDSVKKMLERTIPKMIEIQLVLAKDLAAINADPTQVDQILMNLAVNARDAMPEGGRLVIETANLVLDEEYAASHLEAKPGRYVLLSFADTGIGMDEETLEHMFEPFYSTKGVGAGTGLGLAMVYGIVQQHGGRIRCDSELGQGTTFRIYFPTIVSDEKPEEKTPKEMPAGGSETVLLVDDEGMIRDLCSRILAKAGYKVIAASNGKEALKAYQQRKDEISLVILDLIMPEMGGKQCLESLLEFDPWVKVIIASGHSPNGETREALSSSARGFVDKPYNIRQVLEVVRSVLDEKMVQNGGSA
jgi:two-component system, cell cycle sensor histidine kinase and response regulator CckA